MTITVAPARNEYTANAGQTIFNYTFKIFEGSNLNVYITPSGQTANDATDLTVAYTVTGLGDEDGGTIILTSGANANDLVTIVSNVPSSRTVDYQNNGDFRPDVVNDDFDRILSIVKKIEDNSNRSLLLEQSQQDPKPLSLPNPEPFLYLAWNAGGTGVESRPAPGIVIPESAAATVAALSSVTGLSEGDFVETQGYYEPGDGGGAKYQIYPVGTMVNPSVDIGLSNGMVAALQVGTHLVAEHCGALGDFDGVSGFDNTTILNDIVIYAKTSGISKIVFGSGDFYHTGWDIEGGASYTSLGITIEGNGKAATTFTSDGSVSDDGIRINPESGSYAYNVKLRHFSVVSVNTKGAGGGIKVTDGMSGGDFYELNVVSFANDIWIVGTPFINRFINLYCAGAPEYGFRMDASGTTNTFDNIFVFGASIRGYKLGGAYSNIGCLAADGITGDYAYEFNFFSGSVGSLGNESSDVLRTISVSNSTLNIGYVLAFRNTVDDGSSKGGVISGSGSTVVIDNMKVEQENPTTSTQAPFDMFSGQITVGDLNLTNMEYTGEPAGSTDTEGFIHSVDKSTGIMVSNDGTRRGYIGLDRGRVANSDPDYRVAGTLAVPKAIFLDSVDLPRFDTDGNDYRFGRPARVGDLFLESQPQNFHQAGWIVTQTGSDLNGCDFKRIPIKLSGTTAERPTTGLWVNLEYYDTTLLKPIWWSGSDWRDAVSTVV